MDLNIYETKRQEMLATIKKNNIRGFVLAGIVILIELYFFSLIFFGIFIVVATFILSSNKKINFAKEFKTEVVTKLVLDKYPNGKFLPEKGVHESQINSIGLFKVADRFHSSDLISADHDGINFFMSDFDLKQKVVRSTGRSTYVTYETYAKGRFIVIDFDKEFTEVLKIVESKSGVVTKGLKKSETEFIKFNDKFTTYTSSEQIMFYILTPHFQEKLLELEKMFNGTISFAFMDGLCCVAINDFSDSLEVDLTKPIDKKQINLMLRDISLAPMLIDELKINSSKFTKQNKHIK